MSAPARLSYRHLVSIFIEVVFDELNDECRYSPILNACLNVKASMQFRGDTHAEMFCLRRWFDFFHCVFY